MGDFSKIKSLCSNPGWRYNCIYLLLFQLNSGSQGRFIVPNGPFFKFMHDLLLQKPGRISGILCSQGEIWKEQRNFMIKTLDILGFKNSSLEDIVLEKVESFCQFLKSKKGNSVEIAGLFNLTVVSILWKMTTGENIDFQDSKLQALRLNHFSSSYNLSYLNNLVMVFMQQLVSLQPPLFFSQPCFHG